MGTEGQAATVWDGVDGVGSGSYVLRLDEVGGRDAAVVGGKGAHLGELARIDGAAVPPGFCVTTQAYRRVVAGDASIEAGLDRLSELQPEQRDAIRDRSAEIRRAIETIAIPDDVTAAIGEALAGLGDATPCAVRSSATAEDLPTASFAGQHDSFLNIAGAEAVLAHVRRCWASLFTERAVGYRLRNDVAHRDVAMAVVVQELVAAQAAGVLFTADPVTSNRRVCSVEACPGLGDALVSGQVTPDRYTVRDSDVSARPAAAERPVLTEAQVVQLERLGRRVEAHFGCPQDIEWCLHDGRFVLVQSRPITTLFPIPESGDDDVHVYLSVGHQQMMTDAMKPLGLSLFQLTAMGHMQQAGSRLFVDVAPRLASPAARATVLGTAGRNDPLTGDALRTLLERGDLVPGIAEDDDAPAGPGFAAPAQVDADPAIVAELIERSETSMAALKRAMRAVRGPAALDLILEDIPELKRVVFDPPTLPVVTTVVAASWWLNEHLEAWLGERNAADTLTQSVPGNVTAEMGLALLDVADVIRPHAEVVAFLERVEGDDFLDALPGLPGGREAHDAICGYLDRYGMRCVGEIDITRPRWSEQPSALVPMLLGNIANFPAGAGRQRFEQGLREAQEKERDVLERLRALPDGAQKAADTKRMIDRVRTFAGYREYPKYAIVSRYLVYKQALVAEAERLVAAGVLRQREDAFFLTLQELREAVRVHDVDAALIARRRQAFRAHEALVPPRVLTSEGEVLNGSYRREDVPAGALAGLAVSGGTIEGRARVILDVAQASVEPGDILVTTYTDPSWSPLFVAIAGLVTEVGGLMTHGAVIAREYGLPAVVGVEHATTRIRDGQRIRVHGTDGHVEILA